MQHSLELVAHQRFAELSTPAWAVRLKQLAGCIDESKHWQAPVARQLRDIITQEVYGCQNDFALKELRKLESKINVLNSQQMRIEIMRLVKSTCVNYTRQRSRKKKEYKLDVRKRRGDGMLLLSRVHHTVHDNAGSEGARELVCLRKKLSEIKLLRDDCAKIRAEYHQLLIRNGEIGSIKENLRVYSSMKKSGVSPNSFTYQLLLAGCKNTRPPCTSEAIKIFRRMQLDAVQPTSAIFNILLELCAATGQRTQHTPLAPAR